MLSLSLMLKELQQRVNNLEVGGVGTLEFDTSKIQIGTVNYHDGNPTVTTRYADGNVYLDFVLTNPIVDAKKFGTIVVNSTLHHVTQTVLLKSTPTTTFTLDEKPNECPIVITVNGFSYHETPANDIFGVDRANKTVTWYQARSGIVLDTELASAIYVNYEVSQAVSKQRDVISIEDIVDNRFYLTNVPNSSYVTVIINGVSYFEENNDFTVFRTVDFNPDPSVIAVPVEWNTSVTGFSLDSSLTGYIVALYEIDII